MNVAGAEVQPTFDISPATGQTLVHKDVMLSGVAKRTTTLGIFSKYPEDRAILSGAGIQSIGEEAAFLNISSFRTKGIISLKESALYDALKASDYDLIINPKYIITEKGGFFISTLEIKVSGLAGSIIFD
jgi:hypothetical protein